jgi:hypothetical protein
MPQENETEKHVTGTSALTEEDLAEATAVVARIIGLNRTFPTFDAFEHFLCELLADEFGAMEGARVYHYAKMSGLFNHFYDNPQRWNEIQGLALRNQICLNKEESAAFIDGLFKEFFSRRKPESATEDANEEQNENMRAIAQIRQKVQMVVANESSFGVLSAGEKIAVAFVLDRVDLLKFWGTMLDGADRLGPEWLEAAVHVQRYGWANSKT